MHAFGWWVEEDWNRFNLVRSAFGLEFTWVGFNPNGNIPIRCGTD